MTSAELLLFRDRCPRLAHWSRSWQWKRILVSDALRQAIELGMTTEQDPGQSAGDQVMSLAAERGLETSQSDIYGMANHLAGLADVTVTALRSVLGRLYRPADAELRDNLSWESSAFLGADSVRLHRILPVTRWSKEREVAEVRSVFSLFEAAIYQMPCTMHVVVLGQNRDGRYHGAFSKAVQHPLNHQIRFRKKAGHPFKGAWEQVWREEIDVPAEDWLEAMERDGVLKEAIFEVEVSVPCPEISRKVVRLIERRLTEIQETTETPPPNPSQCWMPQRCPFCDVCWTYAKAPSSRLGYLQIAGQPSLERQQTPH